MNRILPCIILAMLPGLGTPVQAEEVRLTLLQLNDLYEITPLAPGVAGGLGRVAAVRQELLREDPNAITVIAGDFFSPSALGTAVVDGKPLDGRQMVSVLNSLGLDFATFGNHEFDLKEGAFFERLRESRFRWVATNVRLYEGGKPFKGVDVPSSRVVVVRGKDGKASLRVGLIGLTFDLNYENPAEGKPGEGRGVPKRKKPYAEFLPTIAAARAEVDRLKDKANPEKVDLVVALTHLPLEKDADLNPESSYDLELATAVPEIDLILGGHEHEAVYRPRRRCENRPPIFKADANARTVYVHRLRFDTTTRDLRVDSTLKPITSDIVAEPGTAAVAEDWRATAFRSFRAEGLRPEREITITEETLDGRESEVRTGSTNLTNLIGRAMMRRAASGRTRAEAPRAAVYNSGMVRLDDVIGPGPITEYDVKRILPFDGDLYYVKVGGQTLAKLLDKGTAEGKKKSGGYLQVVGLRPVVADDRVTWTFEDDGAALKPDGTYSVVINDWLLTTTAEGFDNPPPLDPDESKKPRRMIDPSQVGVGRLQVALIEEFEEREKLRRSAPPGDQDQPRQPEPHLNVDILSTSETAGANPKAERGGPPAQPAGAVNPPIPTDPTAKAVLTPGRQEAPQGQGAGPGDPGAATLRRLDNAEIQFIASDQSSIRLAHDQTSVLLSVIELPLRANLQSFGTGDLVDVRYSEGEEGTGVLRDVSVEVRELGARTAGLALATAAAGLLLIFWLILQSGLPNLIIGTDNRYSKSKLQMALWFFVLLVCYVAVVGLRGWYGGWGFIGGVNIPPNLLILSGLSALSFAGAKAITQSRVDAMVRDPARSAMTGAVLPGSTEAMTLRKIQGAEGEVRPKFPFDLLHDDEGRVDLGDFQSVVVTLLAVVVYVLTVVNFLRAIELHRMVSFPDVDSTILAAFGLGQGAYLAKKVVGDVGGGRPLSAPSPQTPSAPTPQTPEPQPLPNSQHP